MELLCSDFFKKADVNWLLLGLAPVLGGAINAQMSLSLGFLTWITVLVVGFIIFLLDKFLDIKYGLIYAVILSATVVSIIQMYVSFQFSGLTEELGIYLPLIMINVLVLKQGYLAGKEGSIEIFKNNLWLTAKFVGLLFVIGSLRELLGEGTIFGTSILVEGMEFFASSGGVLIILGFVIGLTRYFTSSTIKKEGGMN
ncbi:MAG: Rnf-Nqr domain containing protein [Halanaerobiales bacterium]